MTNDMSLGAINHNSYWGEMNPPPLNFDTLPSESKHAWEIAAQRIAEKVINDWREAEQYCSADAMADAVSVASGDEEVTLISEDGKKAYRYRLVETLAAKERE